MWKRRVYLILLGVALVGLIMAVCTQEREPGYGGKKLSEWVREYTAPGGQIAEADQAIASIGLKAIPRLVQWIGYEPPTNRRTTGLDQIRKILRDLTFGRWGSDPTETRLERANGAVLALIKLDPQGQASLR